MRLYNLDYLRGMAAFSIMIYHYCTWTFGPFDSGTIIGRMGIYGVSVFYVLSGLTLYHVYRNKMNTTADVGFFFRKRLFRIFPLLWLVTLVAIIISRALPDPYILFLNLSGLFGLIAWDKYLSVGAWSIGNELVFYLFLPVFFLFLKYSRLAFWMLTGLIFGLYCLFAFYLIHGTLSSAWFYYTNPLNHVFLFLGGFIIGYLFNGVQIPTRINLALLFTAVLVFVLHPVTGDQINIVTGWNRIVFTEVCFVVCLCFYRLTVHLPKIIERPLTLLGEASYSVYLTHPLVFSVVAIIARKAGIPASLVAVISLPLTLIISTIVYQTFETYFIRLGKSQKRPRLSQSV